MSRPLKVLLGISGGIAAIKAPDVVRRLRERGHSVRCILTRSAGVFVAPLPLEVLSGHPVYREEYLSPSDGAQEMHVDAARWADVFCIVPATCNTMARLALGLADDFLSTTALAFEGDMVVAPAMNTEMWAKEIVQRHVQSLEKRGVSRVGPVMGPLASGELGMGRMAEPVEIVAAIEDAVGTTELDGRTILVTAGPTREPFDPIRFLSNRSSGKMGYSLAAEAAARGAKVLLVSGPVHLGVPAGVDRSLVETASEMESRVHELAPQADLIIMTAAVADFRPRRIAAEKVKKHLGAPEIDFEPNPDILAGLATVAPRALRVGFAAETGDLEAEALRKLESKKVDFIVANDVSRQDIGFGVDENEVVVFGNPDGPVRIPRQDKRRVAARLLDLFAEVLKEREAGLVSSDH
jgi:phosphopantothenoylcysteine decarboxylase/phosphopantothenate--cysteine ligase